MKKIISTFLTAGAIFLILGASCSAQTTTTNPTYDTTTPTATSNSLSEKAVTFKMQMRQLWSEHVIWTRQYIVSTLANLPDQQTAATRLLKNQEDIGNAIKPYYSDTAGNALAALLKTHITTAVDVIAAAKANDTTKLNTANAAWQQNAKDIADFMSTTNPQWSNSTILASFQQHLKVTTDEVTARIKKDWTGDMAAFDSVYSYALFMGDMFSDGIIKQFPDKF